jgi:hypothetical protein
MRMTIQYHAPTLKLQVFYYECLWERANKAICKFTEHVSVAETTVTKIYSEHVVGCEKPNKLFFGGLRQNNSPNAHSISF